MTYFIARSNLVLQAFEWEMVKNYVHFSDAVVLREMQWTSAPMNSRGHEVTLAKDHLSFVCQHCLTIFIETSTQFEVKFHMELLQDWGMKVYMYI